MLAGWPEDINDVPHSLFLYHAHHDVLTVDDGLILYGESVVIPLTERKKVLQVIHELPPRHNQVPVLCSMMCLLAWNQFRHLKHS